MSLNFSLLQFMVKARLILSLYCDVESGLVQL